MALEPVIHELDGSVHVLPPADIVEVLLNGVSVIPNEPIEIQLWPDVPGTLIGWGMVCMQHQFLPVGIGPGKLQVDGQKRNYTYWGHVQLTLPTV